ncbi:MAG: T9SS type A sorting domain-containing protein [Flavobacteriales bacterium]|nr:T9SS type A sorting domain-containing protein [Flavobacteriales bacterium]
MRLKHLISIVLIIIQIVGTNQISNCQLMYNWNTFTTLNSALETNLITRLLFHQDTLWIGSDKGLYFFNNNMLQKETSFPDYFIKSLSVDKTGKLLIGTGCQGVWKRMPSNNYIIYSTATTGGNGLINDCILSLHSTTDSLWVGTEGSGLFLFYNNTWQRFHSGNVPGNPDINQIYDIEITSQGEILLATGQNGLVKKSGSLWVIYDTTFGLPTNRVHCISPINDSVYWIGLGGNSGTNHLIRMDIKNETILQIIDSSTTNGKIIQNVWNVFTDSYKRHWIGMNNSTTGLTVTNDTIYYTYNEFEAGLQSLKMYDFAEDDSNRIWVASFRGLSVNTTQFGLSIDESNNHSQVLIFPNPLLQGQFLTITLEKAEIAQITDLMGNIIWEMNIPPSTIQWQANVPSGIYIIRIYKNNQVTISKIIIY